jgi:hypothetical protein
MARSKFINDGMLTDLVNEVVGPLVDTFKKEQGIS